MAAQVIRATHCSRDVVTPHSAAALKHAARAGGAAKIGECAWFEVGSLDLSLWMHIGSAALRPVAELAILMLVVLREAMAESGVKSPKLAARCRRSGGPELPLS